MRASTNTPGDPSTDPTDQHDLPSVPEGYRRFMYSGESGENVEIEHIEDVGQVRVGYSPRRGDKVKTVSVQLDNYQAEDGTITSIGGSPRGRGADRYITDFDLLWRKSKSYQSCPVGKVLHLDIPHTDDT